MVGILRIAVNRGCYSHAAAPRRTVRVTDGGVGGGLGAVLVRLPGEATAGVLLLVAASRALLRVLIMVGRLRIAVSRGCYLHAAPTEDRSGNRWGVGGGLGAVLVRLTGEATANALLVVAAS